MAYSGLVRHFDNTNNDRLNFGGGIDARILTPTNRLMVSFYCKGSWTDFSSFGYILSVGTGPSNPGWAFLRNSTNNQSQITVNTSGGFNQTVGLSILNNTMDGNPHFAVLGYDVGTLYGYLDGARGTASYTVGNGFNGYNSIYISGSQGASFDFGHMAFFPYYNDRIAAALSLGANPLRFPGCIFYSDDLTYDWISGTIPTVENGPTFVSGPKWREVIRVPLLPMLGKAPSGPTLVNLAGNQPNATGVLSLHAFNTLAGNQPASSGDIVVASSAAIEGNQPNATGALSELYKILLEGNHPNATGMVSLSADIALAGDQPAPSGNIDSSLSINLAGNQPAASGGITAILYGVLLRGNQPAASGQLSIGAFINLAGNQPAPSGALIVTVLVPIELLAHFSGPVIKIAGADGTLLYIANYNPIIIKPSET